MFRKKIEIAGDRHLETLANCDGYYSCPKDENGKRLGPLVAYAGTYDCLGGRPLQFVGDVYANFAKAELYANVLDFFAGCLSVKLDSSVGLPNIDAFCAAPIGGYSLCDALGLRSKALDIAMIKAEKLVTAVKTPISREKSDLVFGRHEVEKGQRCVIVEGVCNNFSTTAKFIQLIHSCGGIVVGIACFLNRSLDVDAVYSYPADFKDDPLKIPVVSLVRQPIYEYKQNDPAVAEDVTKGNVVWKPKQEWPRLMEAVRAHT